MSDDKSREISVSIEGPYDEALAHAMKLAETFAQQLLGPVATEIGQVLADPVRNWRARRAIKQLIDLRQALRDANITETRAIAPSVLVPALEAASLETDEDMQARWTALLLAAADPNARVDVTPAFTRVLADLRVRDVAILDWLYRKGGYSDSLDQFHSVAAYADVAKRWPELSVSTFKVVISNLVRLGLSEPQHYSQTRSGGSSSVQIYNQLSLSPFGAEFIRACSHRIGATADSENDAAARSVGLRTGDPIVRRCPACDGVLSAQVPFGTNGESAAGPEHPGRFWSTKCERCGKGFNFDPDKNVLREI